MADVRAERASLDPSAVVAPTARIVAQNLIIEAGARVGEGVTIVGGEVHLRAGSEVRAGAHVTAIDRFDLGRRAVLGPGLRATGRTLCFGDSFWSTNRVVIGGGGSQGPDAVLTIGEGTSLFDGAFVNIGEPVTIGKGCALSADAAVLTHGCWQPVLEGFPFIFAPVVIEDDVVVYLKSVILPGVTLGRGTTVAAGSVVAKSTPQFSLVGGVPARVIRPDVRRSLSDADRRDLLIATLLRYASTIDWKGFQVLLRPTPDSPRMVVEREGVKEEIRLEPGTPLRMVVEGRPEGPTTFHFATLSAEGGWGPVADDLRDHLRRSGMKILGDRPFRPLPPARLAALQALGSDEGARS